jgi:methylthioribose-1-phosphate isomerase
MKTLEFRDGALYLLDQTRLPLDPTLIRCGAYTDVCEAIKLLRVRGAPAIGLAAAYGTVLAARSLSAGSATHESFTTQLLTAIDELASTRPTAVNLFWALARMRHVIEAHRGESPAGLSDLLLQEADRMLHEDEEANRKMGLFGAELIPDGANVLTHCNTGALATGAFGTALGVMRAAQEQGKQIHVWVDETRPLLQGARLTAWELKELHIPFTLITDNMAGHFMSRGKVDLAMVGADRIVANGDAANKIGTYSVAVLAHAHGLPFYFVAPTSTVDLSIPSGDQITIEERSADEVTSIRGTRVAPNGISVANPAFDVTPARLITAIVTERGVIHPPFSAGLEQHVAPGDHPVEPIATALAGAEGI